LVVDLDPGPGAGLAQCCEVAVLAADYLAADGLSAQPVTSGSKGMQLYVPFPEAMDAEAVLNYARSMAGDLAAKYPHAIVATMTKSQREQRVFIDWSQNNPAKTTITPYSLRGKDLPFAATPVTWDEVREGLTEQFLFTETMARVLEYGDLLQA
jgi:bifunctional non-homologous end joining protein LigD